MKTITLTFVAALFLLLGATSCINEIIIEGNGILASESRQISDFNRVKSMGSFDVYISKGIDFDVVVSGDENIIGYVETYVTGGMLHIDIDRLSSVRSVNPIEIFITTPYLEGLIESGSGSIRSDYFSADHFDLVLSGSGRIEAAFDADEADVLLSGSGRIGLSGIATSVAMTVSGSGRIIATDLQTKNCNTLTSGSGDMWISVSDFLDSRISGSGNVHYYGTPHVDLSVSGSGKAIHEN